MATTGPAAPSRRVRPARDRTRALQCVRALVGELGRSARRIERRTGLTNAQLFVLRQIDDAARIGGAASVGDVAARTHTRPSTASAVVARLIDGGLVRRETDARDGRRLALTLSPRGRAVLRSAPEGPTERLLSALAELSGRQARAVADGLALLAGALQLDVSAPAMLFDERGRDQRGGTILQ